MIFGLKSRVARKDAKGSNVIFIFTSQVYNALMIFCIKAFAPLREKIVFPLRSQRTLREVYLYLYLFIRVTAVEVWLSSYLPPEDMIANYPPRRMQGTIICVNVAGNKKNVPLKSRTLKML